MRRLGGGGFRGFLVNQGRSRQPRAPASRISPLVAAPLLTSLLLAVVTAVWLRSSPGAAADAASIALFAGALLLPAGLLLRAFRASHLRHRHLAEQEQACSRRLDAIRRIGRIGDWRWDLEAGTVAWSAETFAIYGQPARADGTVAIEEVGRWVHPGDRERLAGYMATSMAGADGFETEFRIVRPDGEVRTVLTRGEWADATRRIQHGVHQDITERARTRERLQAMPQEYRYLFDHNPLPMWVFERATLRFLAVNEAMLAAYGYSREQLLAGTVLDIRSPEDAPAARAALGQPDREQGRVWTHLRNDGTRLKAAIHSHDIVFEGRLARLVLAEDVTERERNEERFQLIARATSDAVWDWDLETGITWRSDSVFNVFGYTRDEIAPTLDAWAQLLHPEDRERVVDSVRAGLESDITEWECRYRLRRKDGSYAEVLDRSFLLRDAHGRAIRAVGGMLDVTQRHRDEASLRLLRRAIEATDNGIVIADAREPDQPVVYVNPAFEQMTGYAADELLGRNCRILQNADREQPALEAVRQALREQREVRALLRNYRKNGELFWNEFHLAPVPDEHGKPSHLVGVLTDVSERQRYEEQLAFRATHDELTGLPNRQLLHDRLQQAIFNADRYGRKAGVIFIDLDDFKLINDSLGHSAGDATLRIVAQRLQAVVRETDTVGRFGGDEFVVVLTEQGDDASIRPSIARITEALSQPMDIAGVTHSLTPSIGWCHYPEAGKDAESLLMHADVAMYQAKQQGRNRAVAYQAAFDVSVSQRLQLISRLREALQRDEFVLHFQPVFDPSGKPVALEALARWQHPERGLLLPAHFIQVCEESGLIVELGRRVLREAARHYALLAAAGFGDLRIAVNVSAVQFTSELCPEIEAVMREFSVPRGVFEIELTESVIMASPERAIETMERIAALGVSIAVDDFGTGYSSLSYLKRLPIDRLKIDRSFVQDLGSSQDDAAICTAIIGLAQALDLGTVAEGVETGQQLEWLRARGCDETQGYLLGRPQPFESLLSTLRANGKAQAPTA